jgi:PAS domain S-box-containing protein
MGPEKTDSATEVKRLQRCISDLVSVLALPAVWSDSEPNRILDTFLDTLLVMLDLDFLYARVRLDSHEAPIDALRTAPLFGTSQSREDLRGALNQWPGEIAQQSPEKVFRHLGEQDVLVFPTRLGTEGDLGLIVAGSQRAGFPEQTESLVLSVAANQLAIGLQQAFRLNERKRVADELDRRVAERTRELAEANKELQLQVGLLQHLPVSAWTLKPDGTPDFVNRVWLEFSGQTLDFVRSSPEAWMTAVHPEDREAALRAFWEGVRTGQGFAFETRSLSAQDGSYRWHLQQAVVLRDAEGKVLKFVGTTTDIDDQKRAVEALRASEANLRRVIDTIPSLSWCNLPDGPNEFLSKGWHDYTGMSPEEAHGWGWSASFHPDDLPPLMNRWQELLVSGEPGEIEARIRRHDGEYRWFLIRVAPFRDESGAILRWYGTSTDIHDRKLAEEALRASEAQLRQIIDSTPGLLGVLSPAGEVEFVSRQNLDYFGLAPEQLKGWRTIDIVHPDDLPRAIAKFTHSLTTGTPFFDEHRYRRADGEYRWFDVQVYPARDTQGRITRWFTFSIDVHDRKLAEEALRASETNLRQTVNSIPGLICTMNPAGEIEELNRPLLEYFGKTPEELRGWRMTDAVHPDDLPEVIKAYTYSITNGTPYEIEHRCRRADGVYRWFQVRASAVRDADDRITGWYVLLTDIEDRKRAEDALRASETSLREILDSIPGLVCTLSPAGEMEVTNRPFLQYFGKTFEEMKDWGNSDAVHPDDMPGVVLEFTNSITTGAPYYTEHRCRRADGVYRWFQNSARPMRDTEGRITRWYCLITDIDDRKRAEDELKRSEARHRVLVETASDAVVSIDDSGAIILANPATKRIFGYGPEELIGKSLTVLMPGAMRKLHETGLKRYLETGTRHLNWQGTEVTAMRANGEEFPAEVSFGEMISNHRKVFTGFIRDISDKKRAHEELLNSQAELARMTRVVTIGQLTASIAHEVNQPLSGIITNASTCLRMLKSDPPNIDGARETAQRAIRDGNRASEVITRLRTLFSRKQTEFETLDLNEAAREVITLLSGELQRNEVILKPEFCDRLPAVKGDRVQLQQVILNLLHNASDAMVTVNDRPRQLLIRTEPDGTHVIVSVQDSGVGFSPEMSERLFEPFLTTKQGGMGIGLSVSRSIVEAHQGRLWAARNAGPGATFAFSIPKDVGNLPNQAE